MKITDITADILDMRLKVRQTVRAWLADELLRGCPVLPYSSQDPDVERTTVLVGITAEEFQNAGCKILGFSQQVFVANDELGAPVMLRRTTLLVQKPLVTVAGTA